MDIYGKDPTLVGLKPELDFSTASDEAKKEFFDQLNEWEENNPGYYFRANIWSWRPIQMIIEFMNQKNDLQLNTAGFGENSGHGLENQEECNKLADSISEFMAGSELKDEEDTLYLCLGMWIKADKSFGVPDEIAEDLDKQFPYGKIIQGGVVGKDGNLYYPAWGTSKWHLEEFVKFLRNCGGFEIW